MARTRLYDLTDELTDNDLDQVAGGFGFSLAARAFRSFSPVTTAFRSPFSLASFASFNPGPQVAQTNALSFNTQFSGGFGVLSSQPSLSPRQTSPFGFGRDPANFGF